MEIFENISLALAVWSLSWSAPEPVAVGPDWVWFGGEGLLSEEEGDMFILRNTDRSAGFAVAESAGPLAVDWSSEKKSSVSPRGVNPVVN
jgi:hypothetical protein